MKQISWVVYYVRNLLPVSVSFPLSMVVLVAGLGAPIAHGSVGQIRSGWCHMPCGPSRYYIANSEMRLQIRYLEINTSSN